MKSLIIITHNFPDEFEKFTVHDVAELPINGTNKFVRRKVLTNNETSRIIVYRFPPDDGQASAQIILNDISTNYHDNEQIILKHGDTEIPNSFNVSSIRNTEDRTMYESLLNSFNNPDESDVEKWIEFNTVWTYFLNKYDKSAILEAKLELLHKCLLPSSAPNQEIFDSEFKSLKVYEDGYKSFLTKIKDMNDDDIFNPNYIEAVKQLRIALIGS